MMDARDILQTVGPEDVVVAIQLGICDSNIIQVERALRNRVKSIGSRFKDGTKIKLNDTVRPKYLIGCTGVVRKVNQKRAVVDFDSGQELGRFAPGYDITVPFDMLEEA